MHHVSTRAAGVDASFDKHCPPVELSPRLDLQRPVGQSRLPNQSRLTTVEELRRSVDLKRRVFELAVAMGGTISGEHGIGIMKSEFLPLALSAEAIAAMKRIKVALDPNGILNPGKIFP